MLDLKTIENKETDFINCFENETDICDGTFQINEIVFRENAKKAKEYIKKFQPELAQKLEQFLAYISQIIANNTIEVDCIEIANFYASPNEFLNEIKKTVNAVELMTDLDKKDLSQYLFQKNYYYLLGYDEYATIKTKFSDYNKAYKQLKIESELKKSNKRTELKEAKQKSDKKTKRKNVVSGIFMVLFGVAMLIIGFLSIFKNEVAMGIGSSIFGLLCAIFGFYEVKKTTA